MQIIETKHSAPQKVPYTPSNLHKALRSDDSSPQCHDASLRVANCVTASPSPRGQRPQAH
jgi:hypothetical protein